MSDDVSCANPVVTLELVCPADMVGALERHPALKAAGRRPRPRALRQTWYDTAEHECARQDLALAEIAGEWRIGRVGLGWPRRPGTALPVLASAIHPAALEEKLGIDLPGPLQPVARLTGQIRRLTPAHEGVRLDCRILSGTLAAMTHHGPDAPERAILRIEIEGPLAAALALARTVARDLPATPSLVTLPQEALLLAGAKLRPLPAPALDPAMPTDEALAILTSGLVSTFLTRLGQIEARTGAEPVHQARVTLRRLRALMLAFRPVLRDIEVTLKPPLANLKEVLGPARDWDVFLSETVDPLARSLDAADAVTDWLKQAAVLRRDAAYLALNDWLKGPAFRDLALRLIGLSLGHGWRLPEAAPALENVAEPDAATVAAAPTADEAPNLIGPYTLKCLEHRWKKTARPTHELAEMPPPELHGLRIKCKKLRYQTEMFLDVVPGKSGRRLIKRLSQAQETMGMLNDGAVATELVRSLRPAGQNEATDHVLAAEAIGLIRGYGVGHARDSREAVMQAWRKLVRHDPF
ncbi:CHAD domain-containing protein [Acidisoma sp.]|uniref:CYTH and CHAD domain-containing protein n=1 Tax=Acidisoma sp. TaxID=1872115 RepID=UPI003B007A4E